jgi:nucleoside-diphosphate-sugar epimerase
VLRGVCFGAPAVDIATSAVYVGRMDSILIAGCGYVGTHLAGLLVEAGHRVWGLSRRPAALPPGVTPLAADLTRPSTLGALPPGLDAVVYAAAAGGYDDALYRAAYVDGPGNLLAALASQGQQPRRVVFTSSTGVYAQDDGAWVDEDSPAEPDGFSGRRVLEGERVLREGPFPSTVIRLGGIYGPGRAGLVEQVRAGLPVLPRGGPRYSNRIHRDDAARAVAHVLALDHPESLYLGVDDEPADLAEIVVWLAQALGVPVPPAASPTPAGPLSGRGNKRCRNQRLRSAGFTPAYPTYREGFAAMLADR